MKALKLTTLASALVLLAACVTINIYFPAAQAEQAAERIVEDILGKQAPKEDKGVWLDTQKLELIAAQLLNLLIPQAQAVQPDFNVNTPQIRQLQAAMKQRHQSLKAFYSSGGIGFTRDARIAVQNPSAIPLKERAKADRLVDDENRDRDALYRAIAAANGHPEWEPDVRSTFAKTWVQEAERGWWYQNSSGNWKQR
ncbi:MAG: YdbL family protein [Chromatiaceae bacterium]|nr:YdbL family protein [Chromatiaceae bacterium]MCP5445105.1 YdbL family protein [Chromatiaceae bacterium]